LQVEHKPEPHIKTAQPSLNATPKDTREHPVDDDVGEHVESNRVRIIGAQALQNAGDQVVKASTVLPWLLAALGSPTWIIGLLVPVRESGSMLPQALSTSWVRRRQQRKWVWVIGGAGQAIAVAAMALTAAFSSGTVAGLLILVELAVLALARSLSSIASKDVLGRIIPKGQRGQINGTAALVSGIVAVTVGLGIRVMGGNDANVDVLALVLGAASLTWVAAILIYSTIDEPSAAPENREDGGWVNRLLAACSG
jgi:hypothetical protein